MVAAEAPPPRVPVPPPCGDDIFSEWVAARAITPPDCVTVCSRDGPGKAGLLEAVIRIPGEAQAGAEEEPHASSGWYTAALSTAKL